MIPIGLIKILFSLFSFSGLNRKISEDDFEKEDPVLLAERPQLRQRVRPERGGRLVPEEDAL